MKGRKLIDLYNILYTEVKDIFLIDRGLCVVVLKLVNTKVFKPIESRHLRDDIKNNMPELFIVGIPDYPSAFGWEITPEGTQQRKQFILQRIKYLSNEV